MSDPAPGQGTAVNRRPGWVFVTLLLCFAASCAAGFLLPLDPADLTQPPVAAKAAALGIVILGTLVAVSLHEWAHALWPTAAATRRWPARAT